jgi:hypothetical protein
MSGSRLRFSALSNHDGVGGEAGRPEAQLYYPLRAGFQLSAGPANCHIYPLATGNLITTLLTRNLPMAE